MNWKDPIIAARLAHLWSEGHSCSAIARMIGAVSRNAIIGAVTRAGLPRRGYRPGGIVAKRNAGLVPPKPKCKPVPPQPRPVSPARAIIRDGLPIPTPADTDIATVSMTQLNEDGQRHCKWPCFSSVPMPDEPAFCGADPVPGQSYCRAHLLRSVNISNPLRPLKVPPTRVMQVA